jgi:membrane fusion protein (multidrug efflux system)
MCSVLVFTSCQKNDKGGMNKGKNTAPIPVLGMVISPQEFDNKIDVIGTILSNEKVDLKSEVSGRVTGIHFKEGSRVSKGALLVKLFDSDLKAQLKKINIQRDLARLEEERKRKLLEISGISQQEYDLAKNQLEALNADAELVVAQIRKTEIIAPFNGVIGLRNISEGEIVSTATSIASLQQIDPIKLEFEIPEKFSYYVSNGSAITFTINGSEEKYQGLVYATEPMIDVATRTLKVRARCDNRSQKFKPGSFIKIELNLQKKNNAILVPSESIIPGAKEQKIFLSKNGIALSKKVKTGTRTDTQIEILEGLIPNDTVITSGIMQLKDSTRIKMVIK